MASELLIKDGDPIFRFCDGAVLNPADPGTDWSSGTPTDVLLKLGGDTAVPNNGGRQSSKVDLGAARAPAFWLLGTIDFTGQVPTAGATVEYYWAPSTSATPANGNVAGNSGLDAAAPDGALGAITLDEFLSQCVKIGALVVHDGGVVQNGVVAQLTAPTRYGQLIVVNKSGVAFAGNDVEHHQAFIPMIPEAQ